MEISCMQEPYFCHGQNVSVPTELHPPTHKDPQIASPIRVSPFYKKCGQRAVNVIHLSTNALIQAISSNTRTLVSSIPNNAPTDYSRLEELLAQSLKSPMISLRE